MADSAGMTLKPLAGLKALCSRMEADKETIYYCQSGMRAAETATVLADLGFKNFQVYDRIDVAAPQAKVASTAH